MPSVSIVIPCFNAAASIQDIYQTLASQSVSDWEAIFVDDGSTDTTAEAIADLALRDARVRCLRMANGGPAKARNAGCALVRSHVIAFLDADDAWPSDRLETTLAAFRGDDGPDAVYGQTIFFADNPARPSAVSHVRRGVLTVRDLMGENPTCTMSNIAVDTAWFRHVGGFAPDMTHGEDLEWLIRLAGEGARICGDRAIRTFYRRSTDGLSADLDAMHAGWARAMQTARRLDPTIVRRDIARAEAIHLRYLGRRALRLDHRPATALRLCLRGMWCSPRGFFSDMRRSVVLLGAALGAPFLPGAFRRALFCR